MIHVTPTISIDENELEFEFVRSGGPGGQNVNKVASAVQLRFDAAHSRAIAPAVFERLRTLAGRRMTKDGVVVIHASRYRTQEGNRQDAIARLVDMVARAAVRPKSRKKTRPTLAAKKKRLEEKRRRSDIKKRRRPAGRDDD
jgi:ribosome-associated protein